MKPAGIAIALACIALVAGCSSAPTDISVESHEGTPDGFDSTSNLLNGQPGATWIRGRDGFAIVTYGSKNCAPIPVKLDVVDEATISVTFVKAESGGCSASQAATTRKFDMPEEIVDEGPVTLEVLYDFDQDYEYTLTLE
jgi:hypothetical protein